MLLFKSNKPTARILESIVTTLIFLWIVFDRLFIEAIAFQAPKVSPSSLPEAIAEID